METARSAQWGTPPYALLTADLTAVIRAWPDLPPHVREAISVLVGNGDGVRKKRRKREKVGERKRARTRSKRGWF